MGFTVQRDDERPNLGYHFVAAARIKRGVRKGHRPDEERQNAPRVGDRPTDERRCSGMALSEAGLTALGRENLVQFLILILVLGCELLNLDSRSPWQAKSVHEKTSASPLDP